MKRHWWLAFEVINDDKMQHFRSERHASEAICKRRLANHQYKYNSI